MRKTIEIKTLIEYVNAFNLTSEDYMQDERQGKNEMLEMVLHQTGNYNGFRYLATNELFSEAMKPGIREQLFDGTWNFEDTDSTRVIYF